MPLREPRKHLFMLLWDAFSNVIYFIIRQSLILSSLYLTIKNRLILTCFFLVYMGCLLIPRKRTILSWAFQCWCLWRRFALCRVYTNIERPTCLSFAFTYNYISCFVCILYNMRFSVIDEIVIDGSRDFKKLRKLSPIASMVSISLSWIQAVLCN